MAFACSHVIVFTAFFPIEFIPFYEAFVLGAGATIGSIVAVLPLIIIKHLLGD